MKKYALLGEHLSHSYSPLIHKEIFNEYGLDATYELLECKKEEIPAIIDMLRKGIYSGFNVTIPYKLEVMQYLDEISEEALAIGAVNTIAYKNGKVIGYNTDYYGFKGELSYYNVDVKGKSCFILGTGGASLALYKVLSDLGGNVYFVSRNPKNDKTISYDALNECELDVIVNATPVGMYPNVGVSPIDKDIAKRAKHVLDIIFNPSQTQLLLDANSKMNGLYMLVGQAVKAEEIWQDKDYPSQIEKLLNRIEMMI